MNSHQRRVYRRKNIKYYECPKCRHHMTRDEMYQERSNVCTMCLSVYLHDFKNPKTGLTVAQE
jgi:hypothetical protein